MADQTSGSTSSCFACSAPIAQIAGLGEGLNPACEACKHRAHLVSSNTLLTTILFSSRSHPLAGSGLNALLSPVIIDGRRGWCDFAAGGYAILEEVFPSSDYFDFVAQHVEPWAKVLRKLRTLPGAERVPDRVIGLLRGAPARFHGLDNLTILLDQWDEVRRVADKLAANPPIRSNEDAWRIAERIAMERPPSTTQGLRAMLDRLVGLGNVLGRMTRGNA